MLNQPDDTTCGPTSLHAVYRFFQYPITLDALIREARSLEEGGTLAVLLGIDALNRGFQASIYSYNLRIFDPSWAQLSPDDLKEKLLKQLHFKKGKKFSEASHAYIEFLEKGGNLRFKDLNFTLLRHYFDRKLPILTGLSATYLYNGKREFTNEQGRSIYDDMKGEPMGHFVVLCGMDAEGQVLVADPYQENPISGDHYYYVNCGRLINSIMLGIVTYDANLLIVEPSTVGANFT